MLKPRAAHLHRPLLALLLAALAAGCTTQVAVEPAAGNRLWEQRHAALDDLLAWRLNGRISVAVERDAWSATLQWDQQAAAYLMRVIAPLAQGTVELRGAADGRVNLRLDDGRVLQADDPESLLQETLGWSVPVSGMAYWIKGMPDPGRRVDTLLVDEQGRITDLVQAGWQISYSRYGRHGELDLPGRIQLINGNLRLRLAIRDWQI